MRVPQTRLSKLFTDSTLKFDARMFVLSAGFSIIVLWLFVLRYTNCPTTPKPDERLDRGDRAQELPEANLTGSHEHHNGTRKA